MSNTLVCQFLLVAQFIETSTKGLPLLSVSKGCTSLLKVQNDVLTLLTYAHRSRWSIGHQRPLAIALCSGLLWPFQSSWSFAVSALLQCLASNCCQAGLSFSCPTGSSTGLGVWCWLPEGVFSPAPLPPQCLLGHWFLSRSLPQIFISEECCSHEPKTWRRLPIITENFPVTVRNGLSNC